MSPVFRVSLSPRSTALALGIPDAEAILKFFDRRCLTNAREEYRAPGPAAEYDAKKERAYRAFAAAVARGAESALDFSDPWSVHGKVTESDGALEAYLAYSAEHMFVSERRAYARLRHVQGDLVPEAYGAITYRIGGEVVCGLLLEHIPAVSLHKLISSWTSRTPRLPDSALVRVCDRAMSCVRRTADAGFLDEDVRLDNFLVRESSLHGTTDGGVVLIDLADGQIRGEESDVRWAEQVSRCDPSGTLGLALERLVGECVAEGLWHYDSGAGFYRDRLDKGH